MNDIDLTARLKAKMGGRPRKRGRYNSSELYNITHGFGGKKLTPEEWLHSPEKDMKQILDMWGGIGQHSQLEELMGKENSEKKKEFVYKDIVLVGKADYIPTHVDEVWEWKSSTKLMKEAKPWHLHQTRLYTTMFNKPIGRIYQPIQDDNGLYLKHLGMVERDDSWFESELQKLYEFHVELEQLWEKLK